jgi:hypothetical protein
MIPFDDTGATLTTDVLAAEPTGNPAGPDAEKRALPAFFAFAETAAAIPVCQRRQIAVKPLLFHAIGSPP